MSSTPSFLCDEMLGRLCRYLRAAGYDALLANGGRSDADLLRQCGEEGRYFLTQDRLVQEHKAARTSNSTGWSVPSPAAWRTTRPWLRPMPQQRRASRPMRSGRMSRCAIARCAGGFTGAARTTNACAQN